MNQETTEIPDHKASLVKTIVFLVVLAVLVVLAFVGFQAFMGSGDDMMNDAPSALTTDDNANFDPVKARTGDTGGTTPSSDGTGPGSDNSLLSPQN